jgi:hypothetical protein
MRFTYIIIGFAMALGLALLGCAEGASKGCHSNDDCLSGLCRDNVCAPGGETPPDDPIAFSDTPDVDETDPLPGSDASPDASLLLGFGEPCSLDAQCRSGYCIDSDQGRICTELCQEECFREGFVCRLLVNMGADAVRLCVPELDIACRPCTNHTQCGGRADFCLRQANGTFCATDCATDRTCPDGFRCNLHVLPDQAEEGGDLETYLCEPLAGACNPIRLRGSVFTATTRVLHSDSFSLTARIVALPHRISSQSFQIEGGF